MKRRLSRRRLRSLVAAFAVMLVASTQAAANSDFRELTIRLDHPVDQAPVSIRLADGPGLLVVGREGDEWRFSIVSLRDAEVMATGSLPRSAMFYDAGDPLGRGADQICLFDENGVTVMDAGSGEATHVARFPSIYHGTSSRGPTHSDFVRDLDGDGLDDIIAPRFDGWALMHRDGSAVRDSLLRVPPRVTVYESRVSYQPHPPYVGDVDGDGMNDLVFLVDRDFISFVQQAPGRFSTQARLDHVDAPLATEEERRRWERDDGQVDQSDLEIEQLEMVRDFDGDGVLDLLTDKSISEGVFDRRSEYHLYLGHRDGDALRYRAEPDGSIGSDGVQFDPLIVDIDGDGRLDIATPSTRLGLGRVVAALFSGKISVDLDVYRMRPDGGYSEESDHRTKFKVEFDLTTGLTRYPAVAIADLDGDGAAELIVQEEKDELAIYPGVDDSGTFSPDARTLGVELPRNGQMLEARDLDDDGLSDLLIRYGPADGDERSRELLILLSGKSE